MAIELDPMTGQFGDTGTVDAPPEADADAPEALKQQCRAAAELKRTIEMHEVELDKLQEQFKSITGTILRTLDLLELDSIRAHGFLFFKETRSSVSTPKTLEEKEALFAFLRERGCFTEMVNVHSATLNSLYKSLSEEALERGVLDFRLPGVAEPVPYTTLKLRRS